jgi:hypothetical protein
MDGQEKKPCFLHHWKNASPGPGINLQQVCRKFLFVLVVKLDNRKSRVPSSSKNPGFHRYVDQRPSWSLCLIEKQGPWHKTLSQALPAWDGMNTHQVHFNARGNVCHPNSDPEIVIESLCTLLQSPYHNPQVEMTEGENSVYQAMKCHSKRQVWVTCLRPKHFNTEGFLNLISDNISQKEHGASAFGVPCGI